MPRRARRRGRSSPSRSVSPHPHRPPRPDSRRDANNALPFCAARPLKVKAKKGDQDKRLKRVNTTAVSAGAVAAGKAAQELGSSAAKVSSTNLAGAAVEVESDSDSDADDKYNPRSLYDTGRCPHLAPRHSWSAGHAAHNPRDPVSGRLGHPNQRRRDRFVMTGAGRGCKWCGSVEHFTKDCPTRQLQMSKNKMCLPVADFERSADADDDVIPTARGFGSARKVGSIGRCIAHPPRTRCSRPVNRMPLELMPVQRVRPRAAVGAFFCRARQRSKSRAGPAGKNREERW